MKSASLINYSRSEHLRFVDGGTYKVCHLLCPSDGEITPFDDQVAMLCHQSKNVVADVYGRKYCSELSKSVLDFLIFCHEYTT